MLSELNLFQTPVTDDGLAHLKGLTNLTLLNLHGTHVTSAGLAHLRPLTKLSKLDLSSTNVTDDGLPHLNRAHQTLGTRSLRHPGHRCGSV